MTPLEYYQQQCRNGRITLDAQQMIIIKKLDEIYHSLVAEERKRSRRLRFLRTFDDIKGLYLWGSVGVGKTFVMDCFYHCLPFKKKMRMHFHAFMQKIHTELTSHQGTADPLRAIAKEIADQTIVICFDEFFVTDITDAMLLGRLLKALFNNGVCLITTSNSSPDDLYKHGVQRLQFLPTIELIKFHTEVVHIKSKIDYRLQHLKDAGVFYAPLNQSSENSMEKTFAVLTDGNQLDQLPIQINGRSIAVKKKSYNVIWFEYADICNIPRSQADYLVIAEQYPIVFISNVPIIPSEAKDQICLFINMVDVFYDAKTKLVISAADSVSTLYKRGHKILEYERTQSRLLEMQSVDYFIRQ